LGVGGNVYVYDWMADKGRRADGGAPFTKFIHGDPSYLVVVPEGKSGIAFLGDLGKFASLGKKRVSELSDDGVLEARLEFASGETSITVEGWAPSAPRFDAVAGRLGALSYNEQSKRFRVEVFPGKSGFARIRGFVPDTDKVDGPDSSGTP
jgi:hypothetical protein